jgi:hypothetical protein
MSIPVAIPDLPTAMERYGGWAFLLTGGPDGRPHAVQAVLTWEGARLRTAAGGRTTANAAAHPAVALVWPPAEPAGHCLIVDADAESAADGHLLLTPTKAVLHRGAVPGADPGTAFVSDCGNDCAPVAIVAPADSGGA